MKRKFTTRSNLMSANFRLYLFPLLFSFLICMQRFQLEEEIGQPRLIALSPHYLVAIENPSNNIHMTDDPPFR